MTPFLSLKRIWLVLLVIPSFVLTRLAANNPETTERVYSRGIYPRLTGVFGRLTGIVPFSLAQWGLLAFVAFIVFYIVKSIVEKNFARLFATLLCVFGIIWFGFTVICGLNYHRMPFASQYGFDTRPSLPEELAAMCRELAAETSGYAAAVARDSSGAMLLSFESSYAAAKFAPQAYAVLSGEYPVFSGFCPRPKPVIGSRAMSMADLVGVYFPFTFEANVNVDVPDYAIPSSMLHELAHFKGFMREDEANFISYLACVSSGDKDFAYSGSMLALTHSLNALYDADRDAYWDVADSLDPGILADFNAHNEYWRRFEGPVAEVSEKVNDVYLKTNRQASGVKSYGQMVDLLIAKYRKERAD